MKKTDEEIVNLVATSDPVLVMSKFIRYEDLQEAKIVKAYRLCEQEKDAEIERLTKELQSAKEKLESEELSIIALGNSFDKMKEKLEKLAEGLKTIRLWMYDMKNNDGKYIYDRHGTVVFYSDIQQLITDTERVGQ